MRSIALSRFCITRLLMGFVVLLSLALAAAAQDADTPNTPPRSTPPPQPIQSTPSAHGANGGVNGSEDNGFVFKKQVEEVVLHATVVDQQRRLETHLDRGAFAVFEDGRPQTITSFRREDVPVAIGIVVDNSGSMLDKRAQVNQAVVNLIRASNPKDEVFVVNFNRNPYLDQDFTSDVGLLERALHQVSTQGDTALYDAVVASTIHLENNPRLEKKILLVITDGDDNMSRQTLNEAIQRLQQRNGPTLYAIGLTGAEMQPMGRQALQKLADATGGAAFFPDDLSQVADVTQQLAHDIRSQYIIAYKPENEDARAKYHPIQVQARAPGLPQLTVRTRTGVFTGESSP
ncbi:MAG: VWA domain-containing protein [Candidatus Sulfotelmatobacter sp.]